MGKKRVHELAKEFGLGNKEVIEALSAAGMDVKTHSSSVHEAEARPVLQQLQQPVPEAPKKRRPGMMIVKKRSQPEPEATAESSPEASVLVADPQESTPTPGAGGTTPGQAEESMPSESESMVMQPDAEETAPAAVVGNADDGQPVTEEPAAEAAAANPSTAETEAVSAPAASGSEATADKPRGKGRPAATVVRMIDREKLLERVPSRRLGNSGDAGGGANSGRGGKSYGQVTELKVVNDPYGRGREMINVGGKDKKGKGGGKPAPGRKGRTPTKREMIEMRERSMYPSRLKRKKAGGKRSGAVQNHEATQPKASKRVIKMKESIVVADLAHQLGVKAADVIRKLMALGMMITQNQSVDLDTAQLVATDYEYTVDSVAFAEGAILDLPEEQDTPENLQPRAPVVTVMGHVDHGKTSVLDAIRAARVAAGEAGGITQHIGAYQVALPGKGTVTFLDTPGHAAFTEMRARGAEVTDIVVLVVAADDGVMPQTEEAIRHAQAAKVPIIVAVNKIDRPEANVERVTQELTKFELVPEAWGGETLYVNTSAINGTGITELVEAILLQAEVLELKANPDRRAVGYVVEAQLDKGRGPVATVLVQQGTLKRGDPVVIGEFSGRIRAMMDDTGKQVKEAGPAGAVEVTGLDGVPLAGDKLVAVESPEAAREVADHRQDQKRAQEQASGSKLTLDELMKRMSDAEVPELKIVLKGDVQGSVEAVKASLEKLSTDEVRVHIIYGGVGGIKESDITLAAASGGLVLGFGVRPDVNARQVADREGVEIRTYTIIYEVVDDVRKAMEGLLGTESHEKVVGRADVREVFKISKVGAIAGCRVIDGKALRAARVRVLRDDVQVFDGRVSSLKHFKNDVREVDSGLECGVGVDGFNDIKASDQIEFYQIEEVARTLESTQAQNNRSAAPGTAPANS